MFCILVAATKKPKTNKQRAQVDVTFLCVPQLNHYLLQVMVNSGASDGDRIPQFRVEETVPGLTPRPGNLSFRNVTSCLTPLKNIITVAPHAKMDPPLPFGRENNPTSSHLSFGPPSSSRNQLLYSVRRNYTSTFSRPNASRSSPPPGSLSSRAIHRQDLRVPSTLPAPVLPTPPSSDFDHPPHCLPNTTADSPDEPFLEPTLPRAGRLLSLSNLTPKTMEQLRSSREGSYIFHNITPAAFLDWQDRYPELIESDAKYEYDGLAERMIIKCMAGHLLDSMTIFFVRRVGDELRDAGRVCRRQLQIASTTGELVPTIFSRVVLTCFRVHRVCGTI